MPRSRVLSFISQFGGPRSPSAESPKASPSNENATPVRRSTNSDTTPQSSSTKPDEPSKTTPSGTPSRAPSRARADSRAQSRPVSMMPAYNPPQVDVSNDTPPELQPIFSYLNSHSNKLYNEGYFLKLHDLDSRGRPSPDRAWVECFAQLIGTVLSLWDANALDAAGEDGEVVPTFINLSDAQVRMIESLPMSGVQGGSLQNVLSVSTAANNRYLLHFNSMASLTQWAAAIRLAMFEHSTLQEAYTGSLIAGKGRHLNNIKEIMFRTQFAYEDWVRVRFGSGTPWKRYWCVVSPPDEKEYKSAQKTLKKSSTYDRARVPKGDIKFYDTRKVTKKTRPVATVQDVFAAYAIYPQSKPLIEQSTLVKLEGTITMHTSPESVLEGFVFVMPEVHAAVSGFEMMLRWLFPVFDTFALYGRPNKLVADTLDQRGLMFAMPTNRRYGYLDELDVSALIHVKGSQNWSERQWRRELKKLTAERMTQNLEGRTSSRHASQRRNTTVTPTGVRFGSGDDYSHSTPGSRSGSPVPRYGPDGARLPRTDSAPAGGFPSPHKRSVSESYHRYQTETPSRLSYEAGRPSYDDERPPPPPAHGAMLGSANNSRQRLPRIQSEAEVPTVQSLDAQAQPVASPHLVPPEPVGAPPALTHSPNSRPDVTPFQAPELRRAHSNVDAATLYQMQDATRGDRTSEERTPEEEAWNGDVQSRQQQNTVASQPYTNRNLGVPADRSQDFVNRKQRDPRHRLSTIPGSPYIGEDAQVFQSPVQMAAPQLNGVDEAAAASATSSQVVTPAAATDSAPLQPTRSIARKPVPSKALPTPPIPTAHPPSDPSSPASVVNDESWEGGIIDEEALDRVLNAGDRSATMTTNSTEPDYASTASGAPSLPKQSMEKPRAGKLKTVGDPDLPAIDPRSGGAGKLDTWQAEQAAQADIIPGGVDFGPTYTYKPSSRPGTSGTLTPGELADRRRSRSADRLSGMMMGGAIGVSPRPSPNEAHRLSYFSNAGRSTPSPGRLTPDVAPGRKTPEFNGRRTPEFGGAAGDRSSVVWQPASTSPGHLQRSRTSVTPEEWVQQRAALAHQQQQYAMPPSAARKGLLSGFTHSRSNSAQGQRKLTKTPPLGRTMSGDWTQYTRKATPPERSSSRGAGVNLDTAGTSLSAREQMMVSRATGTPLINVSGQPNDNRGQPEEAGMIGYVAARERDKQISREGRNSVAVQQAIVERQQQQQQQQQQMLMEQQYQQQYQYQMQVQQQQQMLAAQQWNSMAMAQNQQQGYVAAQQFGGGQAIQGQQMGGASTPGSWYGGQQPQQVYQQQQAVQQGYGGAYLQQGQQQMGGQGQQQWGRR